MQERAVSAHTLTCAATASMESADSVDAADDAGDAQQQEQSTRSRNSNNKLKVLVRSHAMREASPSPPRDPQSPNATTAHHHHHHHNNGHYPAAQTHHQQQQQQPQTPVSSPCIKLTPSSDSHPSSPTRTLLVLSPSASPSPQRLDQTEFTQKGAKQSRKKSQNYYDREEERGPVPPVKCECHTNLNNNGLHNNNNNNTLTVGARYANGRGKLRQQSSSLGSFDSSTSTLSRDNSAEQYTDTTGVDLEIFIPETLNRNQKDRNLMLRIEEELVQLAKDDSKTHFKFPPMSSYQRMLVHRCAAYFGMEHNIESTGKCVVVNKTKNTRIPDVEFKRHIKDEYDEEPRRSILKRDSNSVEDYGFKSPDRQHGLESRRSKSFEEREEEYEKAKRRIFNKGNRDCSNEDVAWSEELSWSTMDHDKYRLHHPRSSRLLKVQSEDPGEETMRPCVAKSYSFGGYGGGLARGDSMMSTHSAGARLFSKQDSSASSVSWHLSPSSSGYKTQSQRSESVTPSPTSTPFYDSSSGARQDSTATNASDDDGQQVVWAVTNIQSVPKGSVIINPATGQPIKNHDGTLYHHDPDNPLPELPPLPESGDRKAPQGAAPVSSKPPVSPAKVKKEKRASPIKKTNSATSPSLPYTPPPPPPAPSLPNLSMGTIPMGAQLVQSKSFPGYGEPMQSQYYGASAYDYAPPCIVYAPAPYGYDARIEPSPLINQEIPQPFYVDASNQLAYPPAPPTGGAWPQPQYVYSNAAAPRFVQQPPAAAFIASYPASYPPQPAPATNGGGPEMIPVYPPPQSLIYPAAPGAVFPPNQGVIYTAPQVFPNATYPVSAPTPNGYNPAEGVAQLHLGGAKEERRGAPKTKGRSQSSTEASSPATAVMAAYHRQNSETPPSLPPSLPPTPGYGTAFPPMFIRQMSNVRASPPAQSRASRSPTPVTPTMPLLPGAEMMIGEARHRYPMPPFVYQTMPYTIPSDSRIVAGRGQPNVYRQQSPRPPASAPDSNSQYNPRAAPTATALNDKFRNRKNRSSKPINPQYNNKKAT